MKPYLIILSILLCISCDPKTSKDTVNEEVHDTKNKSPLSKSDIETIDYVEYGLSSASKKVVRDWESYTELETLVNTIKGGDLSYFSSDKEIIKTFFFELSATIPEQILSQPIALRINALKTKFYKLQSAITLPNVPKKEVLENVKEFFVSVSNLNLQMNKKLEKDAQSISKSSL